MNVAQAFFTYLNSFATSVYPTKETKGHGIYAPVVPVTIYHKKTNAAVPVTGGMLVDTGAEDSILNDKYAKAIGLEYKAGPAYNLSGAGGGVGGLYYAHKIPMKIGNLNPLSVNVLFGPQMEEDQVIGRGTIRQFILTLTQQQVRLSEYQATTKAAYAKAYHAALLNASNTQSHFRNRM